MTRDQELLRAGEANRLLNDPLMKEAFEVVETSLTKAWLATGDAQERERERLWLMQKLMARVKAHLETVINTGKLAEKQMTDLEKKQWFFGGGR